MTQTKPQAQSFTELTKKKKKKQENQEKKSILGTSNQNPRIFK